MKDATPSGKNVGVALSKLTSKDAEKIANKYRKACGMEEFPYDFLVDVDLEEDWKPLLSRKGYFVDLLKENKEVSNSFNKFLKELVKKYPEYTALVSIKEWNYLLTEFFFLSEIQPDTIKTISGEMITWDNNKEKFLTLKIYPGTDKKDIVNFFNRKENDLDKKFKEIGLNIKRQKNRAKKEESYNFDLWVRVLDTFKSEEIREAFALKFPIEYKSHFAPNGKRITLYRAKYELIAHYLFHRFNLKSPKNEPYKADYVKAIIEKAKKNKTQIKNGLIKKIP